jgi:transposase
MNTLVEAIVAKTPLPDYCFRCGAYKSYYPISTRASYSCASCGLHIHPLAWTNLFKKSTTALEKWKIAYQLMQYDPQVSAKTIERVTKVTYKTAWRMRKLLKDYPEEAELYLK